MRYRLFCMKMWFREQWLWLRYLATEEPAEIWSVCAERYAEGSLNWFDNYTANIALRLRG